MFLRDLIREGTDTISAMYPEREAREMVYSCLEHHLGTSRHTHIIEPDYVVTDEAACHVRGDFSRMASGEPMQYVLGKAYFYGREFKVTPDVLIPRPETEMLCRAVIDREKFRKGCRVLDMCTGSGCIAWTLALELPGSDVTAVDVSEGALRIAAGQEFSDEMAAAGAKAPSFLKRDVLNEPYEMSGSYDVIVSNPPYVMESEKALMRANVLDHEPHLALFVSDDDPLVFYRAVAGWAQQFLRAGGFGIVEINEALAPETEEVFLSNGFDEVETIQDLSGRDRFVTFVKPLSRPDIQ